MLDARPWLRRLTSTLPALLCLALVFACGPESPDGNANGGATEPEAEAPALSFGDLTASGASFKIVEGVTPQAASYGGNAILTQEGVDSIIEGHWQTEPMLDAFAAWAGPGLACTQQGEPRLCMARGPVTLEPEEGPAGVVVYTRQEDGGLQASWYRGNLLSDGLPGGGSATREGEAEAGFVGTYCITYTDAAGTAFPSMQLVINPADSGPAGPAQYALEWWKVDPSDGVCGEPVGNAPALEGVGMQLDDQHMTAAWGDIDMQLHILAYSFAEDLSADWKGKNDDGTGRERLELQVFAEAGSSTSAD